jgi:hypothetical protein
VPSGIFLDDPLALDLSTVPACQECTRAFVKMKNT